VRSRPLSDLDTLLTRVASRATALRAQDRPVPAPEEEREMIADLAAIAARLRESTTAIGARLATILDADEVGAGGRSRAGRRSGGTPPRRSGSSGATAGRDVDPLTRIAILRGTDKWGPHFYTPVYHELFQHLRELPIRLLEIGVGGHESPTLGGASLLMWADYFPHARIVGIDVAEKRLQPHPRITILRGSQADPGFLAQVVAAHGPFDIVVDDGSHAPADVHASFNALFPTVVDDGFYVVEDVQTAFWPRFGGSPSDGAETMTLARRALDAVNHAEIVVANPQWEPPPMAASLRAVRAYHNLLVFEKGDNREPSTRAFDAADSHVIDAVALMEQALAATPTPEGLANLARTYALARRFDQAIATVKRGLERWPDNLELLAVGAKTGRRDPEDPLGVQCLDRLRAVAGDDPCVDGLTATNRSDAESQGTGS
jgi:hypothetical protein